MSNPVMTPRDARWAEFVERLEGPEGCNFHEDDQGSVVWSCPGGHDKPAARRILTAMGYDVDQSLDYFEQYGGHCDCEILFNVNG